MTLPLPRFSSPKTAAAVSVATRSARRRLRQLRPVPLPRPALPLCNIQDDGAKSTYYLAWSRPLLPP
jgi:hypothetical protein